MANIGWSSKKRNVSFRRLYPIVLLYSNSLVHMDPNVAASVPHVALHCIALPGLVCESDA